MFSGAVTYRSPVANYTPFDQFAKAVNCTQPPGPLRLVCLKKVPAGLISNLTNANPSTFHFEDTVVDKYVRFSPGVHRTLKITPEFSYTIFTDSLQRIQRGQFAKTPILIGDLEGDGTIWALFYDSIREVLESYLGPEFAATVTDDQVRALYPGQNDSEVMSSFIRDDHYRWCVPL